MWEVWRKRCCFLGIELGWGEREVAGVEGGETLYFPLMCFQARRELLKIVCHCIL